MENNNEKSFYDIRYILTQLDVSMSLDELHDQLKGINFNKIKEKGMFILSKMVGEGKVKAVKYLLENGANPNLESSSYHYYKGSTILYALQNNHSKTVVKLEILKMLIDYGCNVNATVNWHDEEKEKMITGNHIEYGLKLGLDALQILNDSNFNAESRKSAKNKIEGLQAMLSLLQQSGLELNMETSKKLQTFLNVETKNNKEVDPKKFFAKALKELNVNDRIYDLPIIAKEVCFKYLENETFIPSEEWAELVKHLIKVSLTFEEVSEEVYDGEIVSFADDEGWLSQGWSDFNWFNEIIDVLSVENALGNSEWDTLLMLTISECPKFDAESIGEKVINLLDESWVQSHKSFEKISVLAEEYFEY